MQACITYDKCSVISTSTRERILYFILMFSSITKIISIYKNSCRSLIVLRYLFTLLGLTVSMVNFPILFILSIKCRGICRNGYFEMPGMSSFLHNVGMLRGYLDDPFSSMPGMATASAYGWPLS